MEHIQAQKAVAADEESKPQQQSSAAIESKDTQVSMDNQTATPTVSVNASEELNSQTDDNNSGGCVLS